MALGAAQQVTDAGITPSYSAPLATDKFAWPASNPEFVIVHVKNANAGICNVAAVSQAKASDGLAVQNKAVAVPATTGDKAFRVSRAFKDSNNEVNLTFSVQSSVSVAQLYY